MKQYFLLVLCVLPFMMGADLRFAQRDLANGRYIMAAREFRKILASQPEDELASLGLARTQVAMGRCDQGYARLLRLRHSWVWTAEASNAEGICLLRSGQFMEALAAFQESIQMRPDYPVAWYGLYQTYVRIGSYPEAEQALDELTGLIPGKTLALTASMDWLQRLYPEVAEMQLENQKRDVHVYGNPALHRQWAMMEARRWLHLGHPAAAISTLEPIWNTYPNNAQTSGLMAEAYRRTGDLESAQLSLKHALVSVSEHPVILGVRARIAFDLGEYKKARRVYQQMAGHHSEERFATEWYLFRTKDRTRAREAAQHWWAFSTHPDAALVQYIPWRGK